MFSFFQLFKKKRIKEPKKVSRSTTFYHQENTIFDLKDLHTVFDRHPSVKTKHSIRFQENALESINVDKLEDLLGEESYIIDNSDSINGHRVYFYRKNVNRFNLLFQIHFLNKKFFFATTKISTGNHDSKADKHAMLKTLLKPYSDIEIPTDNLKFEFADYEGNMMFTTELMYFFVNYAINPSTNNDLKQLLEMDYLTDTTLDKVEQELKQFL